MVLRLERFPAKWKPVRRQKACHAKNLERRSDSIGADSATGMATRLSGGDRGSVFVESVIAAAIVAMALGGAFQMIVDGVERGRDVQARRTALLLAQSELAAAGSEIPLQAGEEAGVVGDLIWRVEVSPYSDGIDASAAGGLWRVAVSVRPRAGGEALARLETLRLGPKS
jgi:hypothetical protein